MIANPGQDRTIIVLGYHKIGEPPADGWETWYYVPRQVFRAQLQTLLATGWHPIDHATFVEALDRPERAPTRSFLVTFDDAYRSLVSEALPVLEDLGVPAVVFVPTHYIGGTNAFDLDNEPEEQICDWDDLRHLHDRRVSVQSHGVRHAAMSELNPDAQREELQASRRALESGLGTTVDLFAFPYGDDGDDPRAMAAAVRAAGYRAAFGYGGGATDLRRGDRFRWPRAAMGPDTDLAAVLG